MSKYGRSSELIVCTLDGTHVVLNPGNVGRFDNLSFLPLRFPIGLNIPNLPKKTNMINSIDSVTSVLSFDILP